jgi:hypothetical protein
MPADGDNSKSTEAIRKRSNELAASGGRHTAEAELLAALSDGTLSFDQVSEEALRLSMETSGSDAVIDALIRAVEDSPMAEEQMHWPELAQEAVKAEPIRVSPLQMPRKPSTIPARWSGPLVWIAAAAALAFVCLVVFRESRPQKRTTAGNDPAQQTPAKPEPSLGGNGTETAASSAPKTKDTNKTPASGTHPGSGTIESLPANGVSDPAIADNNSAQVGAAHPSVSDDNTRREIATNETGPADIVAGDPELIQKRLVSQIRLTKAAADHSDIVIPGDVVVLHKDGLLMCSSASPYAYTETYNNGVLAPSQNRTRDAAKGFLKSRIMTPGSLGDAANNGCVSRKFVAGEKFWVTDVALQKDGILVSTISDPYNDTRYYGQIKFPFPRGSVSSPDDFAKIISEVITVQPTRETGGSGLRMAKESPTPDPAIPPVPPLPPMPTVAMSPIDTSPMMVEVGQSKEEVASRFGPPALTADVGAKEIYFYNDFKVTFLNGTVNSLGASSAGRLARLNIASTSTSARPLASHASTATGANAKAPAARANGTPATAPRHH